MSNDPAVVLEQLWNDAKPDVADVSTLPPDIVAAIEVAVNAKFKLFRYVLPSQLLAKTVEPTRHALALQDRSTLPGSFDARSFCKRFITPFDEANHGVLGGSEDPGVGNIWRYPQIDDQWLAVGRRRSAGGDALKLVLDYAQAHPNECELLLRVTLVAVAHRLARTKIVYPRPNRIAHIALLDLVERFLDARSGGRRLQVLAAALFDTIGERFGLFDEIDVGHINRADAAGGNVADIDCRKGGVTVLSVEVKDRDLSVREVADTLRVARDQGVAEILYVLRGNVPVDEKQAYEELQTRQFAAGHNVYDIHFSALVVSCSMLFSERGRLLLLERIGVRLDQFGELSDRQEWQAFLAAQ